MSTLWFVLGAVSALAFAVPLFYRTLRERERDARRDVERARDQALERERAQIEHNVKSAARDELSKQREALLLEETRTRDDLRTKEGRVAAKEDALERRLESVDARERAVTAREAALAQQRATVDARAAELEVHSAAAARSLERVAGLTREEARHQLLERLETEGDAQVAAARERVRARTRAAVEAEARSVVLAAIERAPVGHWAEALVTTVHLPSDEAKMRIVGREGRNVRALEEATGVDVLIDDTPGLVVISGFDPVRREIARRALERLLQDGRIHPVAVEHAVQAAKAELEELVPRLGAETASEAQVGGLSPALLTHLGRLEFRTSYGQNVRRHSIEVARLASALAGELGVDPAVARRAGLLHDIGKAPSVDESAGHHSEVGASLVRREGETDEVALAIARHHAEVDGEETPLGALVRIADRISADRRGARDEQLDASVRRFEDLEQLAGTFPGVKKAYAVQAGRELRVVVDPVQVSDKNAARLARDVAKAIEDKHGPHPGEVRVTVLRELRVSETAR